MGGNPSINLILTDVCTNGCRYCFASGRPSAGESNQDSFMNRENFLLTLEFLKKSCSKEIRFLGGEPLIHPHIQEFLERVRNEDFFEHITIFTGGIFPRGVIKLLAEDRTSIVANCNHPKDYEKPQFAQLLSNLGEMASEGVRLTIGYNIYEEHFEFSPILELCRDLGVDKLRLCIANPNPFIQTEVLDWKKRKEIGHRIYELLMACVDRHYEVVLDCVVTPCVFTDSEWGEITKFLPGLANGYGVCGPALDVDKNLYVSRCFAYGNAPSVKMLDFESTRDIYKYFSEEYDQYKWYVHDKECQGCRYLTIGVCQGDCLGFHYKEMETLREKHQLSKTVLGEAYSHLHAGHLEAAVARFEEALRVYSHDGDAVGDYAFTLMKLSETDKALTALDNYLLDGHPIESGTILMTYGLLAELQQDKTKAIRFYRRALRRVNKEKMEAVRTRIRNLEV